MKTEHVSQIFIGILLVTVVASQTASPLESTSIPATGGLVGVSKSVSDVLETDSEKVSIVTEALSDAPTTPKTERTTAAQPVSKSTRAAPPVVVTSESVSEPEVSTPRKESSAPPTSEQPTTQGQGAPEVPVVSSDAQKTTAQRRSTPAVVTTAKQTTQPRQSTAAPVVRTTAKTDAKSTAQPKQSTPPPVVVSEAKSTPQQQRSTAPPTPQQQRSTAPPAVVTEAKTEAKRTTQPPIVVPEDKTSKAVEPRKTTEVSLDATTKTPKKATRIIQAEDLSEEQLETTTTVSFKTDSWNDEKQEKFEELMTKWINEELETEDSEMEDVRRRRNVEINATVASTNGSSDQDTIPESDSPIGIIFVDEPVVNDDGDVDMCFISDDGAGGFVDREMLMRIVEEHKEEIEQELDVKVVNIEKCDPVALISEPNMGDEESSYFSRNKALFIVLIIIACICIVVIIVGLLYILCTRRSHEAQHYLHAKDAEVAGVDNPVMTEKVNGAQPQKADDTEIVPYDNFTKEELESYEVEDTHL